MNPELEAEIYYLTEEEGGRKTPVMSGYRGQFYYNGRDWDASQEFMDKDICHPGETVEVRLQTLSPIFHVGQFCVGQEFEIREGARTVGKGKITNILREDFNYWDFDNFYKSLPMHCKSCDKDNLQGFLIDFDNILGSIEEIEDINFIIDLSNFNCMLDIKCVLKDKNIGQRPLADKICEIWQKELSFNNNLWKVHTQSINDKFKFELLFATWHDLYLAGKIEVKTM